MQRRVKNKKNLASIILTILIILLLVLSQPALSLLLSITGPNECYEGQIIKLMAKVNIQSGEWVNIDSIKLVIEKEGVSENDTINIPVKLTPGVKVVENVGCSNTGCFIYNITVNETTNAVFGYGYGYGYISPYGYGYGYLGWSYGYGYGYGYGYYPGYGYGYNVIGAPPAVIAYDIYWKPNTTGTYKFKLVVTVTDRNGSKHTFESEVHKVDVYKPTLRITPASKEIHVGETTTFDIVLDKAPLGLAGYKIWVKVDNPSVANIVGVEFPSWAKLSYKEKVSNGEWLLKACDLDDVIKSNATNVLFARITIKGYSAGTTKIRIVGGLYPEGQVCDDDGNLIPVNVENATLTVKSRVVTAGGGAGGGGGYVPSASELLTAPSITHTSVITYAIAGKPTTISVPEKIADAVGLLKVEIITDKSLSIYAVISAANIPSGAPSPPGDMFSCFEIVFTKYGTTQKVEPRGYVEFRVAKSWLSETGHKPEDIVLMKLSGDKWIELKTEITQEDSDYVYYKAEVSSFSIFAVVAKAKAVAVVTPTVTPTAVPTVAPTKTPMATPTTPPPSKPFEWTWIVAAIVVIAILLLVVAYFTRRR